MGTNKHVQKATNRAKFWKKATNGFSQITLEVGQFSKPRRKTQPTSSKIQESYRLKIVVAEGKLPL